MPTIEFDPQRLLVLHRKARDLKAIAHAVRDAYDEKRERASEVSRRALTARQTSEWTDPAQRAAYAAQAAELEAEAAALKAQMADLLADQQEHLARSGAAARAFRRALAFALDSGLAIPPELAEEARAARARTIPQGATTTTYAAEVAAGRAAPVSSFSIGG